MEAEYDRPKSRLRDESLGIGVTSVTVLPMEIRRPLAGTQRVLGCACVVTVPNGYPDGIAARLRKAVMVGLFALPLVLGVVFRTMESSLWFRLLPRVMAVMFLIIGLASIRNPKWMLPGFIAVCGPLQAYSLMFSRQVSGYPVGPFSLAIWGMAILWLIRGQRGCQCDYYRTSARVVAALWLLIVTSGLVALFQEPGADGDPMVTTIVLVRGGLEALILYLLARAWIRAYGDLEVLVWALCLSAMLALVVGLTAYSWAATAKDVQDSSSWRFSMLAYGGANCSGFILVIIYPLVLMLHDTRREATGPVLALASIIWALGLASLPRATPIVLEVETLICCYCFWRKKVAMSLLGLIPCAALVSLPWLPEHRLAQWLERWRSTDLIGLATGKAESIDRSDSWRFHMQEMLWHEAQQRPFGGLAATGITDPEDIYLDTAVQLGWGSAAALVGIELVLLSTALKRASAHRRGEDPDGAAVFSAVVGQAVYTLFAGINLAKVAADQAIEAAFVVNSMPAAMFAVLQAICLTRPSRVRPAQAHAAHPEAEPPHDAALGSVHPGVGPDLGPAVRGASGPR